MWIGLFECVREGSCGVCMSLEFFPGGRRQGENVSDVGRVASSSRYFGDVTAGVRSRRRTGLLCWDRENGSCWKLCLLCVGDVDGLCCVEAW